VKRDADWWFAHLLALIEILVALPPAERKAVWPLFHLVLDHWHLEPDIEPRRP
jgi:hypothetical protein